MGKRRNLQRGQRSGDASQPGSFDSFYYVTLRNGRSVTFMICGITSGFLRLLLCAVLACTWFPAGNCNAERTVLQQPPKSATRTGRTTLGVTGTEFTVNGRSAFLVGISYYAGLGATEAVLRRDLATIKRDGFRWLRVWAVCDFYDNDVSAVDGSGNPREPYLTRLKTLVAACDRQGLIVDVTLTRGSGAAPHLASLTDLNRAVETVVTELKPYRNWYLDLANERNVGDRRFVSFDELKPLRETVRRLDPDRLVTASEGGDIGRDELRDYLLTARVDFVCPHRPRDRNSPAQTEAKTRELLAWMKEMGRVVPVHYQEPLRRGYTDWQPSAEDFAADMKAAQTGGAAGWCFHNGGTRGVKDGRPRRSFDLRDGSLFDQLDAEERGFIERFVRKREAKP